MFVVLINLVFTFPLSSLRTACWYLPPKRFLRRAAQNFDPINTGTFLVGLVCMYAFTGSRKLMAALIGSCSDGDWVWLSLSQWTVTEGSLAYCGALHVLRCSSGRLFWLPWLQGGLHDHWIIHVAHAYTCLYKSWSLNTHKYTHTVNFNFIQISCQSCCECTGAHLHMYMQFRMEAYASRRFKRSWNSPYTYLFYNKACWGN